MNSKEQISSKSLMLTVACCIQCSSLLYGYISDVTKQDTWIVALTGFLVSLPIIWVFGTVFEKFPGKNIIEINDIVFGKVIGKILSVLYIFFFFTIVIVNGSTASDFVVSRTLPQTPKAAIIIMLIIVCAYSVRKGLEVMTRYSGVFYIVAFGALLSATILLLKDTKISNFQPILSLPFMSYVQGTHQIAVMPIGDIFAFTMIFPNLKNPKNIKKPLFFGIIFGFIEMLGIFLIDIAVWGPTVSLAGNPAFDVLRLINIANFLTRMEFVFSLIMLMLFFFKISIFFYIFVKAVAQFFNIKSYKALVPVMCIIIISFSIVAYSSSMESTYIRANIWPAYATFFEFILPLITLIVIFIKQFSKKAKAQAV